MLTRAHVRVRQTEATLEENIELVSRLLLHNKAAHRGVIVRAVVASAATQPEKTAVYATLVGLLNALDHDLGRDIMALLFEQLQAAALALAFDLLQPLARLCADLVNACALLPNACVALFNAFLADLLNAAAPQRLRDACVCCTG